MKALFYLLGILNPSYTATKTSQQHNEISNKTEEKEFQLNWLKQNYNQDKKFIIEKYKKKQNILTQQKEKNIKNLTKNITFIIEKEQKRKKASYMEFYLKKQEKLQTGLIKAEEVFLRVTDAADKVRFRTEEVMKKVSLVSGIALKVLAGVDRVAPSIIKPFTTSAVNAFRLAMTITEQIQNVSKLITENFSKAMAEINKITAEIANKAAIVGLETSFLSKEATLVYGFFKDIANLSKEINKIKKDFSYQMNEDSATKKIELLKLEKNYDEKKAKINNENFNSNKYNNQLTKIQTEHKANADSILLLEKQENARIEDEKNKSHESETAKINKKRKTIVEENKKETEKQQKIIEDTKIKQEEEKIKAQEDVVEEREKAKSDAILEEIKAEGQKLINDLKEEAKAIAKLITTSEGPPIFPVDHEILGKKLKAAAKSFVERIKETGLRIAKKTAKEKVDYMLKKAARMAKNETLKKERELKRKMKNEMKNQINAIKEPAQSLSKK